ncbi:metallophosphoesterase family protein [Sphingomonas endophytica]|uniref:Serine/threonine protein phosphatase 1 n=1 Tax=Sphingomonas endophytica TaxID=869719 RepID=A0ABR6N0J2_9SPHN|nr:metallophosphoesterase family protein [Sphingomonas endophytica]MBB5724309.1 serine/threonine protein phosphatase 1 [Sphingomonas endophytica]
MIGLSTASNPTSLVLAFSMLKKLLRSSRVAVGPAYAPAPGSRIYAIGDIHGCRAELDRLLAMIDADDAQRGAAETSLIFLGDLVDRGPDSAGVIARLMRLAQERPRVRFLKGNHEELFLHALGGAKDALRMFCRVGGKETVLSYGVSRAEYDSLDYPQLAERMDALVPPEHRAFLEGFEDLIVSGDYAFVHAGVRPDVPLDEQKPSDLRWIRDSFLDHRGAFPKMIVHGHTITPEVDRRPNRIGVDTGAYASGKLTAIGIEDCQTWILNT